MATSVYFLCAVTSASCAVLLGRMFWIHRYRARKLLLWSGVCFACFAVSNSLMFTDMVMVHTAGMTIARAATACVAGAVLLFGLIWDAE